MLKSALITAATAVAITAGAFGVPTASAGAYRGSATVGVEHRDTRWQDQRRFDDRYVRGPVRVCEPVVRTVKVRGDRGWQFKRVVAGERCEFVRRGW